MWHPDWLLAALSSRQMAGWEAYYSIEPWGEMPADVRSAIIASTIANVNRRKGAAPFKVADFMPKWDRGDGRPKRQTVEQMKRSVVEIYEWAKRAGLTKKPKPAKGA